MPAPEDVEEEDAQSDVAEDDTEEEALSGFGEPCEGNQDCELSLCLEIENGKICSTYCDDVDCPEGYSCDTWGSGVVPFCQPDES